MEHNAVIHQAQKMYPGRASYEFHAGESKTGFQADGFRVCVSGHVIAECEDSECADFICQAWNTRTDPVRQALVEALEAIVRRFDQADEGTLHVREGVAWAMANDARAALDLARK